MKCLMFGALLFIGLFTILSCSKNNDDDIDSTIDEVIINDGFAKSFDYRSQNVMTKTQGPYGSCGVFAAMGVLEALIAIETAQIVDLFEQQYINASTFWNPNMGVNPWTVFQFRIDTAIVIELRLPYQATLTTDLPEGVVDYILNSFEVTNLAPLTADESRKLIKQTLLDHGPVAVAMDITKDLNNYQGDIFNPPSNSPVFGEHWVVIVGWNDDPSVPQGGYWVIKNSDGPNWGEECYLKSPYTVCNVDRYVSKVITRLTNQIL